MLTAGVWGNLANLRPAPRVGGAGRGRIVTGAAVTGSVMTAVLALAPGAARAAPAVRHYQVDARSVSGGATSGSGPLLVPGRYVDTFGQAGVSYGDGTVKYYRVRLTRGTTPYVSATAVPSGRPTQNAPALSVKLTLEPVHGDSLCATSQTGSAATSGTELDVATAVVGPGTVGGPDWNDCPVNTQYAIRVARVGEAFTGEQVRVELAVSAEPAAGGRTEPDPAASLPFVRPEVTTARRRVLGGTGFDDAPLLVTGNYRDTFTSGERRYYRVHLDWGQRLAYTLTPDQLPSVKDYAGADGEVLLFDPVRRSAPQSDRSATDGTDLGASGGALYGSSTAAVRYANRTSDVDAVSAYASAGDYYLVLSTAYPTGSERSITVPYTLSVQVLGTATPGPSYALTGTAKAQAAGSGDVDATALLLAGIGAGVVVLAALAYVVVTRRRQRAFHT